MTNNAFLSSLYIYNPSLGQTDTSIEKQLVFHYSHNPSKLSLPQESDKQLRAIGLSQGIIEFARAFSPNSPLQQVQTQHGFSVPVEVEKPGWWILAVPLLVHGSM